MEAVGPRNIGACDASISISSGPDLVTDAWYFSIVTHAQRLLTKCAGFWVENPFLWNELSGDSRATNTLRAAVFLRAKRIKIDPRYRYLSGCEMYRKLNEKDCWALLSWALL